MADFRDYRKGDSNLKTKSKTKERLSSSNVQGLVYLVLGISLLFICASFFGFFWGRKPALFDDEHPLDNALWGNLGDFVGGLLGAILAAFSFYMMFRALEEQRKLTDKTNDIQEASQELHRFNSMFFELLGLYHRQVESLDKGLKGRGFFDENMKRLQKDFHEYSSFGRGWRYAKEKYLKFYLENASSVAPVFRTLYRLFYLIDNARIDEKQKHDYAKTVRAQLSEGELFFLRYNCVVEYGAKFADLINKYRITKHLPFLSLLENTQLREKVNSPAAPASGLALNMLIYSLWKEIYDRLTGKIEAKDEYELYRKNARYRLEFVVRDRRVAVVRLSVDSSRRNNTPVLKCIDDIVDSGLTQRLLNDFVREVFIYSSSRLYNDLPDIRIGDSTQIIDNGKVKVYSCYVAKREGILRVSHPDLDEYYGIKENE